jgi:hypothetical protein
MSWAGKVNSGRATVTRMHPKVKQGTISPSGWYFGYKWLVTSSISISNFASCCFPIGEWSALSFLFIQKTHA